MTFTQAREKLGNRTSRKVANNTYLVVTTDRNGARAIGLRLHSTNILVFSADGSVEVHTGGWQTVTTKARINEYLPAGHIYQKAGDWFWHNDKPFNPGDIVIVKSDGSYEMELQHVED